MSKRTKVFWGLALCAAAQICSGASQPKAASKIEFNRDVRALLSDNCFACHGPDEKQRKAKLRFDIKEEAFKPAKSGDFAIVPGDLKKSQLVARITSQGPRRSDAAAEDGQETHAGADRFAETLDCRRRDLADALGLRNAEAPCPARREGHEVAEE